MELMLGYKRSDVGVIPEDWDVLPLGECLVGRPRYGINAAAAPYSDALPVYIRITDISEDGRFSPDRLVSVKSEQAGNYYLSDGDIVFARTGASVGKSYRYNPNDGALVFAGFLIRVRPDANKLLPSFAAAYVTTGNYWRWIRLMSMRSGQPGINGNEYSQLPIPLPLLPEQRAIAQALSDVDELLATLEKMIAKKRDLKLAAMQKLLTGKTRLPGFSGDWTVKQLKHVAPLQRGFDLPNRELRNGPYPVVYSNGVINHHAEFQVEGPGVVTGRSGTIGKVTYLEDSYWPHNTALWVTSFENNDPRFIFYLYTQIGLERFATGSGVPTLNRNDVHDFEVAIPPTSVEQSAIATVLTDLDTEIFELESRLDKTRNLKQAMMQELLTGKTRLI